MPQSIPQRQQASSLSVSDVQRQHYQPRADWIEVDLYRQFIQSLGKREDLPADILIHRPDEIREILRETTHELVWTVFPAGDTLEIFCLVIFHDGDPKHRRPPTIYHWTAPLPSRKPMSRKQRKAHRRKANARKSAVKSRR